jgi:PST family polysaccharide transporter
MKNLRDKTISGIAWNIVSNVGQQVLGFVIGAILAHLLSPKEFGLIAMITVITGFAGIFSELGFSAALVQKRNIGQEHLSTVFWLNIAAGLLLTLIFMAGSPLIASFYKEPQLVLITIFISVNFLINSLCIVQKTLMTRDLDFRTLSIVEIATVVVPGLAAIVMAYSGFGVWSLVIQSIVTSFSRVAFLWRLSKWRPRFEFHWWVIRNLIGFSSNFLGTRSLNYWARNLDNLLIGRFLGMDALGVYSRAYSVMMTPLTNVSRVISRVMFPSFSVIQEDKQKIREVYLKITRTIALVTFPLMFGLFVLVKPFVMVVFGPKWTEMIPLLQVLCLLGIPQSIGTLNGNLYLSQGRADLQFRISLILKANILLSIIVGLRWGVMGVAIGYTIASLINSYPSISYAVRLINMTFFDLLRNLSGIFVNAAMMAAAVWVFGLILPDGWSYWVCLAIQVPFGILIYFMLLHTFKLKAYLDIKKFIYEQWQIKFVKSAREFTD